MKKKKKGKEEEAEGDTDMPSVQIKPEPEEMECTVRRGKDGLDGGDWLIDGKEWDGGSVGEEAGGLMDTWMDDSQVGWGERVLGLPSRSDVFDQSSHRIRIRQTPEEDFILKLTRILALASMTNRSVISGVSIYQILI